MQLLVLVQLHLYYASQRAFCWHCLEIFHKWLWAFLYSSSEWSEEGNMSCPGLGSSQGQGGSCGLASRSHSPELSWQPRGERGDFCCPTKAGWWLLHWSHRLLASGWAVYYSNFGIPCCWLRQHGFGWVCGRGSLTITLCYLFYPACL